MTPAEKYNLTQLRQQVPLGLKHGLDLLRKTNGDIAQAAALYHIEWRAILVQRIVDETGVSPETVERHLPPNSLYIDEAIKSLDEERFTFTERILRKNTDHENALIDIMWEIARTEQLRQVNWIEFEDYKTITPELYCVVTVMEWLNHLRYSHFEKNLYFKLEPFLDQVANTLSLPQIAETLWYAKEQALAQFEPRGADMQEFYRLQDLFENQTPILINTLFEYVKKHVAVFP